MFRDAHSTIKLIKEQISRDYTVLLLQVLKYFIVVLYKNPLGVTHRLGEVTRQVYWYTGAVTLWKRLLSLIMLCIMFSMSLRFSVLKILCVTMA